jgi:hypothetical protein
MRPDDHRNHPEPRHVSSLHYRLRHQSCQPITIFSFVFYLFAAGDDPVPDGAEPAQLRPQPLLLDPHHPVHVLHLGPAENVHQLG